MTISSKDSELRGDHPFHILYLLAGSEEDPAG
jgi:hypothetical protein